MLKTELTELLGIKHPIIQAGMGPFSNNNLCVATANAGVLGLLSTSGLSGGIRGEPDSHFFKAFVNSGEANPDDDALAILESVIKRTYRLTKDKGGIFGINVLVSTEVLEESEVIIGRAIRVRKENPELADNFKVIFTSAGDPLPWGEKIKSAGFKWLHVVPSVRTALRCQKAGVDCIVASGHESGFHIPWEPVHSMVLVPAVVEALAGSGIPIVGAGGFCDGKTLAAALALGASGVQMGTRFLATKESDFFDMWKDQVVETPDRGTLVARGIVGPARWLKTATSLEHQKNTIKMSPGVFLGTPDDFNTIPMELIENEKAGLDAVYNGDKENALMAGGECAQRITDLPPAQELVDRIVGEAEDIMKGLPKVIS